MTPEAAGSNPVYHLMPRKYNPKYYAKYADKYREKQRRYNLAARERNRKFVLEYLCNHPCVDCGEPDPIVLEFDHVRGTKSAEISAMVKDS